MQIAENTVVALHFTLTNQQGAELDRTRSNEPLTYLHGRGNLVSGLEEALEGKRQGDRFEVTLEPQQAYGEHSPDLIEQVDRSRFPEPDRVEVGMRFQVGQPAGAKVVTVTEVSDDTVTVDGNHPLAGETLSFAVEVVEVRQATTEERQHGHAHGPGGHHG